MSDIEFRAHEFALEMVKIYESCMFDTKLKTARESKSIKFNCDEAITIYKAVFEEAKKKFSE